MFCLQRKYSFSFRFNFLFLSFTLIGKTEFVRVLGESIALNPSGSLPTLASFKGEIHILYGTLAGLLDFSLKAKTEEEGEYVTSIRPNGAVIDVTNTVQHGRWFQIRGRATGLCRSKLIAATFNCCFARCMDFSSRMFCSLNTGERSYFYSKLSLSFLVSFSFTSLFPL